MADYESAGFVLEDLRSRIDDKLYDIRRDLFEETRRIEGEATGWIDNQAKKWLELQKRVHELETEMDNMQQQHRKFEEEARERLTRLETLSLMGSLVRVFNKAQKDGIQPIELLEEAVRLLGKVKGRRIGP